MMKLQYAGRVDDQGRIIIKNKAKFSKETKAMFEGKEVVMTIERKKKRRTSQQNAYLWGVVYTHALEGFKQVGNLGLTTDDVHEFFKAQFLESREVILKGGIKSKLPGSTREQSVTELTEYIERIKIFCAEMLNVEIPESVYESF